MSIHFPTLPFFNQHFCYKFSPGLYECVNFPPTFQRSKIDSREREGLKILFQSCFLDAVLPTKKVKRSKRSFSSRFLAPIKTLAWASKVTKTPSRGPPAGLIRCGRNQERNEQAPVYDSICQEMSRANVIIKKMH